MKKPNGTLPRSSLPPNSSVTQGSALLNASPLPGHLVNLCRGDQLSDPVMLWAPKRFEAPPGGITCDLATRRKGLTFSTVVKFSGSCHYECFLLEAVCKSYLSLVKHWHFLATAAQFFLESLYLLKWDGKNCWIAAPPCGRRQLRAQPNNSATFSETQNMKQTNSLSCLPCTALRVLPFYLHSGYLMITVTPRTHVYWRPSPWRQTELCRQD